MIWLAWRQHRKQALFAIIGLAVLAALLVPTGLRMHRDFVGTGLSQCLDTMSRAEFIENVPSDPVTGLPDCQRPAGQFQTLFDSYVTPTVLLVFLPLLLGLFFGAPLVAREVEHGTHRLVWTQGVTRRRWALVKIGVVGASAVAISAAYAALTTWWLTPLALANGGRFDFGIFDLQGLVPIGYSCFGVAVGIVAGTVWRRILPAMAATLAGFLAVRLAVTTWIRPHLQTVHESRIPITADKVYNVMRGDWILDRDVYDAAGHLVVSNGDVTCGPPPEVCHPEWGPDAYNVLVYQPADRFWHFQYLETGLYVALTGLLLALAVYQIRRRIA
jgi:ABC-2 family transporter protein